MQGPCFWAIYSNWMGIWILSSAPRYAKTCVRADAELLDTIECFNGEQMPGWDFGREM